MSLRIDPRPAAVIIGSGLAGLNAARELSAAGVRPVLIDDNPRPGGQYLRRPAGTDRAKGGDEALRRRGLDLLCRLTEPSDRADFLTGVRVLGLEPDGEVIIGPTGGPGRVRSLRPEVVIVATGTRERFVPFPGWTLPGVISTGAAQILLKAHGVMPGREMVAAGCGPLPLVLASEAMARGGRVKALVDQNSRLNMAAALPLAAGHPGKLIDGLQRMIRVRAAGTPVFSGWRIMEARGDGRLEEVTIARLNVSGGFVPGSERTLTCDSLAMGDGFVPNLELALVAGCRTEYLAQRGGWVVAVNAGLGTSLGAVLAAGEVTGLAGAAKSVIEGRMAGLAAAARLGRIKPTALTDRLRPLARARRGELRFGRFLTRLCRVPDEVWKSIDPRTMICRCEDVTLGLIRDRLDQGFTTPDAIKKATRSGMGDCQGRTCGPVVDDIIRALTGNPAGPPLSARFPAGPVALAGLADLNPTVDSGADDD